VSGGALLLGGMAASGGQQRPRNRLLVGIIAGVLVVIIGLVSVSVVLLAGDDTDESAPRDRPGPTETAEPLGPPAEIAFRPVLEALPKTSDCSKPDVWCTPGRTDAYRLGPAELRTPDIVEAAARLSDYGQWVVGITLSDQGATQFEEVTRDLADNTGAQAQLAVVVDDVVISAPTVQTAIPGGEIDISADFTQTQAEQLAAAIDP
jgi:preprotein translocase subunit SecD